MLLQDESPDPRKVYRSLLPPSQNHEEFMRTAPRLIQIALHVFSICPNSASCERLFSAYGQILTDRRASLLPTRMCDLAELKLHIRREFIANQERENIVEKARAHYKHLNPVGRERSRTEGIPSNPAGGGHSSRPTVPARSARVPSASRTPDGLDMDIDYEDDLSGGNDENSHTQNYRQVFDGLSEWATEDSQPATFLPPRPTIPGPFQYSPIPLFSLLKYDAPFWRDYRHATGIRNTQDEEQLMEYYATGEPANDGNPENIDESSGGILDLDNTVSASLFM
jgi:hypothetical protein